MTLQFGARCMLTDAIEEKKATEARRSSNEGL
jgi:hypothetical protein